MTQLTSRDTRSANPFGGVEVPGYDPGGRMSGVQLQELAVSGKGDLAGSCSARRAQVVDVLVHGLDGVSELHRDDLVVVGLSLLEDGNPQVFELCGRDVLEPEGVVRDGASAVVSADNRHRVHDDVVVCSELHNAVLEPQQDVLLPDAHAREVDGLLVRLFRLFHVKVSWSKCDPNGRLGQIS
jgi:hypothetical protein